jgi:hypothetical protein
MYHSAVDKQYGFWFINLCAEPAFMFYEGMKHKQVPEA